MERQRRPLTFWAIVAVIILAAMTALWIFGDEPTGFVLVVSSIFFWGAGLALILIGLLAISRWRREPEKR